MPNKLLKYVPLRSTGRAKTRAAWQDVMFLMKKIILSAMFISAFAYADYDSKWIKDTFLGQGVEDKNVINAAKIHFLKKYPVSERKIDYEYSSREVEGGYIVRITELFLKEDGEYAIAADGDICIYLDKGNSVVAMKQCMMGGITRMPRI